MVFESISSPLKAEKWPIQMLLWGVVYFSLAVILSLYIFYEYSSLIIVFLTVLASAPLVHNTIRLEERKDEMDSDEVTLLKEHGKALAVFMFLFLGITIAVAIWYIFLPAETIEVLFSTQTDTFHSINPMSGGVIGMTSQFANFSKILTNNICVLIWSIAFSLIYGLGALFILTWNASVIGVAIGMSIRKGLIVLVESSGVVKVAGYFGVFTVGFLKYSIHGPLEIAGYFLGGLAGGIISVALVKHSFGTRKFDRILWDTSTLLIVSVMVLIVAAVAEVWVTPLVF